ncbi:hypothetical protein TNCV_2916371 [Trichonephila clavipes]|nr:hypothetical protein TNCV_2916371 [Trichonephila clavipes]
MSEKVSVLLDCPTVSSEDFVAVDNGNVGTVLIMADKDSLEFIQSSKNIDVDSDTENEINMQLMCFLVIRNEEHHEKYAQLFPFQR